MVGAPEESAPFLRTPVLTEELGKEVVDIGRVTSTDQHEAKFQTSTGTLPSLIGSSFSAIYSETPSGSLRAILAKLRLTTALCFWLTLFLAKPNDF